MAGLVAASNPGAAQQPACLDEAPLVVADVGVRPIELRNDSHVTAGDAAFLHEGDRVAFEVTVENRLPELCAVQIQATDNLHLAAYYLPAAPAADEDPSAFPDDGYAMEASAMSPECRSLAPGERCTETVALPPLDGEREVVGEPVGEQRVRFEVANVDGPGPGDHDALLAGAERVLVVGASPDLVPSSLAWHSPADPEDRHTTYAGEPGDSTFNLTVGNEGTYPNWNPNGGHQYADRSAYDAPGDGDLTPEEAAGEPARVDDAEDVAFPCRWASPWPAYEGQAAPACSYRRGELLDMPVHWTVTPGDGDEAVEEGVDRSRVYSDLVPDVHDKPDAIAHEAYPGASTEDVLRLQALERHERAGLYELDVHVDEDPEASASYTPEADEANNAIAKIARVRGVDAAVTAHGIEIPGREELCTRPADPCSLDEAPLVDPTVANQGDEQVAEDPLERWWNATVTRQVEGGGEAPAVGADGDAARARHDRVPAPGTERAALDEAVEVAPPEDGGRLNVRVRLDQPIAYEDDDGVTAPDGRVAEVTEGNGCPEAWDDPDAWSGDAPPVDAATNTYCVALYYEEDPGAEAAITAPTSLTLPPVDRPSANEIQQSVQ